MLVTQRRLLEWVTADRADDGPRSGLRRVARRMWQTPVAAGVIAAARRDARTGPPAAGAVRSWSCGASRRCSPTRPAGRSRTQAAPARRERAACARLARQTWRFFDDLVGPADHWLIPDNIQEDRREPIAHRTSPTNIGLQLLSTLAAYDFGYVDARRRCSTGSSRRSTRCCACSAIAATSTTGTTRARWRRWRRPTFRPSTAATWPAIC